jgi:hypothetical protein
MGVHQPAPQQCDARFGIGLHRQEISDFAQITRVALQDAYDYPNPIGDLLAVFDVYQFSQLFLQSVVQFLTAAHRRPPLVVKQPNYAVFGEQ